MDWVQSVLRGEQMASIFRFNCKLSVRLAEQQPQPQLQPKL